MKNELYHAQQNENEADRKNNPDDNKMRGVTFLEIPLSYTFFLHPEKRHQDTFNDLKKSKFMVIRHQNVIENNYATEADDTKRIFSSCSNTALTAK